ncbi:alpha-crystallin B chain-like [Schistocerca piceifrons]|uniref:alpha-crystallin B chain-like n=1 Tax=Schistocerca piceifrons TaxID=274613 RepID=UPI001F5FC194|nr:alpha-crystallin B chain-like [Schistocerca piceifrons]
MFCNTTSTAEAEVGQTNDIPHVTPWYDRALDTLHNNMLIVRLDVQQLHLDNTQVKLVGDFIVALGQHKKHPVGNGCISRQFTQSYKLLTDVEPAVNASRLSAERFLTIPTPRLQ